MLFRGRRGRCSKAEEMYLIRTTKLFLLKLFSSLLPVRASSMLRTVLKGV